MANSLYVEEIGKSVNLVRTHAKSLERFDEEKTKKLLIYPMIKALGWNELRIIPEFRWNLKDGKTGKRVDYALFHTLEFGNLRPSVIIEAKNLSHRLTGTDETQLREYAKIFQPSYAVLTNGKAWGIYKPVRDDDSNFNTIDIIEILYDSPSDIAKRMRRISNDGQR